MLSEIALFLEKEDNFFILTHHNADVDAIASALVLKEALEKKGKKVRVGVPESVSEVARNFLDEDVEIDPKIGKEKIIVVDTSAPEQLEPIKMKRADVVIDHHIKGNLDSVLSYVDSEAHSCSQIIYKLCGEMNSKVTERMANLLIGGIIYDTAHLRRADKSIFVLVGELLGKTGKSYQEILNLLRTEIDISERIAVLKALKRINSYRIGDVLVSFTSAGSFEASTARNLLRLGSDVAIVGSPRKKSLRISGRMRWQMKECMNLADIFSSVSDLIGGSAGGHDAAASANGKKPENMNKAFDKILTEIEKKLGKKSKKL